MMRFTGWTGLAVALATLSTAAVAHADGTPEERIREARELTRRSSGDLEAQLSLVIVLVEERRAEDALSELDVLDALAPRDERSAYWRARALLALSRPQEAEEALRDAESPGALELRGQLREERGERERALEDYGAARAMRPTLDLDLAAARLLERLGRIDEAVAVLDEGVRRSSSSVLRERTAQLARRSGRYPLALRHVDALIAVAPSARWRVLRAGILVDAGRGAEAEAELDRAARDADERVERRPSALTLSERARVCIARGDSDGARRDLEQAIRLAPAWPTARRLLAQVEAGR